MFRKTLLVFCIISIVVVTLLLCISSFSSQHVGVLSSSTHEPIPFADRFNDFTDTKSDNEASWKMFDRIVIIPDLHGDHRKLVDALVGSQLAEIVNVSSSSSSNTEKSVDANGNIVQEQNQEENNQNNNTQKQQQEIKWIANRTLLVQLGDMVDRGPDDKLVMDTMMKMQEEAIDPKFGTSRVAVIVANHEVLQIQGAFHYAHRDSAAPFGGATERIAALQADGKYGKWLRKLPAIVEAWDTVFVHAGLTKRVAQLGVQEINRLVWRDIDVNHRRENPFIFDDEGPVWTRLMVSRAKVDQCQIVEECLEILQRKRIVVGHTPFRRGPRLMCEEKLLGADVGLSRWMYNGTSIVELVRNETNPEEVFFNELVPEENLLNQQEQEQEQQKQQEEVSTNNNKNQDVNDIEKVLKQDPSALDEIMQVLNEEKKDQEHHQKQDGGDL